MKTAEELREGMKVLVDACDEARISMVAAFIDKDRYTTAFCGNGLSCILLCELLKSSLDDKSKERVK